VEEYCNCCPPRASSGFFATVLHRNATSEVQRLTRQICNSSMLAWPCLNCSIQVPLFSWCGVRFILMNCLPLTCNSGLFVVDRMRARPPVIQKPVLHVCTLLTYCSACYRPQHPLEVHCITPSMEAHMSTVSKELHASKVRDHASTEHHLAQRATIYNNNPTINDVYGSESITNKNQTTNYIDARPFAAPAPHIRFVLLSRREHALIIY